MYGAKVGIAFALYSMVYVLCANRWTQLLWIGVYYHAVVPPRKVPMQSEHANISAMQSSEVPSLVVSCI